MGLGLTNIEAIVSNNVGYKVKAGDTVWIKPDYITARDFAGPNAVLKMEEEYPNQPVFDPDRIIFTFDCGHDLKYSSNQDIVRAFARKKGINKIIEIDHGIGTLALIHKGFAVCGSIITGTDSHFGILGAVGALGIPAGDTQTAFAFKTGLFEYTIPETIKIILKGSFSFPVSAKDIALFVLKKLGAAGALDKCLEFDGEVIDRFDLGARITLASLGAEMSASAVLIPPSKEVLQFCRKASKKNNLKAILPDNDANYSEVIEIDITGISPLIARPGNPRDAVEVDKLSHIAINQVLIGSCTNANYEDIRIAAEIISGKKIHPEVRLYIVPGTEEVYQQLAYEGWLFKLARAGAVIYPPACAGCTSEQVGKLTAGTVALDTGNRNFSGKQGPGVKYLASPETAAASAIEGRIVSAEKYKKSVHLDRWNFKATLLSPSEIKTLKLSEKKKVKSAIQIEFKKPIIISGRAWLIGDGQKLLDNVDTDAIYHNSYLQETDAAKMGKYTFQQFPAYPLRDRIIKEVRKGDILVVGNNFGAGSSREHAVKCFISLGFQAIIGKSFAPIYRANAENLGFPLLTCQDINYEKIGEQDILEIDLNSGEIRNLTRGITILCDKGLSPAQMLKYQAGGIFKLAEYIL